VLPEYPTLPLRQLAIDTRKPEGEKRHKKKQEKRTRRIMFASCHRSINPKENKEYRRDEEDVVDVVTLDSSLTQTRLLPNSFRN
jgi:hypothetical protein